MEDELSGNGTDPGHQSRQHRLQSSSKSAQLSVLKDVLTRLDGETLSTEESEDLKLLLPYILNTYPRQLDRAVRKLIQACIRQYIQKDQTGRVLQAIVSFIGAESQKPLPATSAFVLLEWSNVLDQVLAGKDKLDEAALSQIYIAQALCLDTCLQTDTRKSLKKAALVTVRRGLRTLFTSEHGSASLTIAVDRLATASTASPRYACLLGSLCERVQGSEQKSEELSRHSAAILDYYVKVILGNKTQLPSQQSHGLDPFFSQFVTKDQIAAVVFPAIEKASLRTPENVLQGPISALARALPSSMELSEPIAKLTRPLLSAMTSSKPEVRSGARESLSTLLAHAFDTDGVRNIDKELLANIKASKAAGFEQRILVSSCLEAIQPGESTSLGIVQALLPLAVKEANEAALRSELAAIAVHTPFLLEKSLWTSDLSDQVLKGLSEKKSIPKKLWTLGITEAFLSAKEFPSTAATSKFVEQALNQIVDTYTEIAASFLPAAQNGTMASAYSVPVLIASSFPVQDYLSTMRLKAAMLVRDTAMQPSGFLLNPRAYSKLTAQDDQHWFLKAIFSVTSCVNTDNLESMTAWGEAMLHLSVVRTTVPSVRRLAIAQLADKYLQYPAVVGSAIVHGIWSHLNSKESNAAHAAGDDTLAELPLKRVINAISPPPISWQKTAIEIPFHLLEQQAISTLVLYDPTLVPGVSWVDTCLEMGIDPGELTVKHPTELMDQILSKFNYSSMDRLNGVELAACRAAATLAFVAPQTMIPLIINQIMQDLSAEKLVGLGAAEATIGSSEEGVLVVDPNVTTNGFVEDKNVKDYDTLKWEQELRVQLAKKKGAAQKKLSPDQQKKVDDRLVYESQVRARVRRLSCELRRGAAFIAALANGPPIEARAWISAAIVSLSNAMIAGASIFLDGELEAAFLACSCHVSDRLGTMRPFIGVAFLRTIEGFTRLPANMAEEPLEDLCTRVLYRLRFAAEQRPFDTASLAYTLPLIFTTLDRGRVGTSTSTEDADAQVLLVLEFLSFQTSQFSDGNLPRAGVIKRLLEALQKYPQHYRLIKDTVQSLTAALSTNTTVTERDVLLDSVTAEDLTVRTAALQAIHGELDLTDLDYSVHVWVACQDVEDDNAATALAIWAENGFQVEDQLIDLLPDFLSTNARSTRTAASKALAQALALVPFSTGRIRKELQKTYLEEVQPLIPKADKRGIVQRGEMIDPWEKRSGLALAFKEIVNVIGEAEVIDLVKFLVGHGPLSDRNEVVRSEMIDAGVALVEKRGKEQLEILMALFEETLQRPDSGTRESDWVNEAVIILYGSIASHLSSGDQRLKTVLSKLIEALSTPSESVQLAVANRLPPLVRSAGSDSDLYINILLEQLLESKKYAARRGAAYGLAGIVKGKGISALRKFRVMSALRAATEDKKSAEKRQGAMMAYELMSLILGRTFEPYVVDVLPQLLVLFGDSNATVRDACLDAAKTCFRSLSSYGVQRVLPELLSGLEETQWRSKKGACDLLGAMAYLDPQQLAQSLPDIIPPLTAVLTDTHKEVRAAANSSLKRFGEVITNPEVKSLVDVLLRALSDPTKYTEDALDGLIRVSFVHYLDAPSLALVVRILERGLSDRSSTKRKAAQIIGSLAHLTEKRDISSHLPILTLGLRTASVDPVPATRATAAKALGSLVEKLGEDALPDLVPNLMGSLRVDTGASDRLGSAQALSEVLAGLGTLRLEETLPSILQNVSSTRAVVREGFMTLFIYLPACFGNSFANYLAQIIPAVLSGLADEVEAIRDTALRAGRLLVKNFATKSIDLLLPELQRGLADENYRIRLSSVELVGDLLFNLTGVSSKVDADEDDENVAQAGASLLEVLGEDRRNRVLSSLYICRCDTSGLVRAAAIAVWKALVSTPRTLREIVPTLTQMIIARLGSTNTEQQHIAANALGEIIRKSSEGIFASLLPTLEEGLQTSTDADNRQGICIALRETIQAATPDAIEDNDKKIIGIMRIALTDSDEEVRDAAADAFDALQSVIGKRAVDQVLPHLLSLLTSPDEADNALSALLTLLTEPTRANAILPNLIPTLLTSPISAFNAKALASLAKVGGAAMNRRLPAVLNTLADNILSCREEERGLELSSAFDAVLCSVDEYDGLNTAMSVMLQMIKHDDHRRRAIAATHLEAFFNLSEVDYSRYNQDLIRVLLISFDDRDNEVVRAAHASLTALQIHLKKEEMESLTASTCAVLRQVGTPGHNLPGFQLTKGIQPVLAIFLQGLLNGTADQRLQAANGISDIIDKTSADGLKPFVTQITGPLIRIVGEKKEEVKTSIIHALNQLLDKIPALLRPFLPQLQRTFTKCIADPTSEILRGRAIKALSTLIKLTPRIDPLVTELTTGARTAEPVVRNAMLRALQEVVSGVGEKLSEPSRDQILSLMDAPDADSTDTMVTMARLLGSMVKVLPPVMSTGIIKSRVLVIPATLPSILALNAVLSDSPSAVTASHLSDTIALLQSSLQSGPTAVQHASVLAIGKLLLNNSEPSEATDIIISDTTAIRPLMETLSSKIKPGSDIDTRRLALVVLRTVSRHQTSHVRPFLPQLLLPVYQSLRDPVIPIKLAAEACFITMFDVVDSELEMWDEFCNSEATKKALPPPIIKQVGEYMKRVGLKLAAQKREQKEAEGGAGGLGLSSDEVEDEKEVWSVGRVETTGTFDVDS